MPGVLSGSVCARGAPWNRLDGGFGGQIRTPSIFPLPMPRADCLPLPPGEVCSPRRAEARAGHLHTGRTHLYHGLYQNEPAGAGLVGPGNEAAWSAALGTWPPRPPAPGWAVCRIPLPKDAKFPSVPCCAGWGGGGRQGVLGKGGAARLGVPSPAGKQEWGGGLGGMLSCLPGALRTPEGTSPVPQCAVANVCD